MAMKRALFGVLVLVLTFGRFFDLNATDRRTGPSGG